MAFQMSSMMYRPQHAKNIIIIQDLLSISILLDRECLLTQARRHSNFSSGPKNRHRARQSCSSYNIFKKEWKRQLLINET